jgi:mannose-6-phosphate isomerase-like protein (cupin superfamily)
MIAVATRDAVVVAPRNRAQDLKSAVETLQASIPRDKQDGRKSFRSWGFYEQLSVGAGFRVMELSLLPGARLSLHRHRFRSEHWLCIAGEGLADCDDEQIPLAPGAGVFIPLGSVHRVENMGSDLLRIIEVQIGGYTGEDDM